MGSSVVCKSFCVMTLVYCALKHVVLSLNFPVVRVDASRFCLLEALAHFHLSELVFDFIKFPLRDQLLLGVCDAVDLYSELVCVLLGLAVVAIVDLLNCVLLYLEE